MVDVLIASIMKPLKFPLWSTLALFAFAGLLALYIPLPQGIPALDISAQTTE
jgi:hypothetical protein